MKNIIFLVLISCMITSCVRVKIQSDIPNQTYYSLDGLEIAPTCSNINAMASFSINVLSPYDTKNIIIVKKDKSININEKDKWIDLPRNMIRNAFMKIGLNNCMKLLPNAQIRQQLKSIKLNINDMYIYDNGTNKIAKTNIGYELFGNDANLIKSGVVSMNSHLENDALSLQEAVDDALLQIINQIKKDVMKK